MTKLLILFAFVVAGLSQKLPKSSICVGEAQPHSYPHHVSIRYEGNHICSGAIIHPEWVITVAQCAIIGSRDFTIRAGVYNISSQFEPNWQDRAVAHSIIHPAYNNNTKRNDIALMRVVPPFDLNNYVATIRLPPYGHTPSGYSTVTGWDTKLCRERSLLFEDTLPIITDEECVDYFTPSELDPSMICSGYPIIRGLCGFGNPMIAFDLGSRYLSGLSSWGISCSQPVYPYVFTEVSHFRSWIRDQGVLGL